MEPEPENLILLIHGERFPVSRRMLQVSGLLKMLTEMFPNQEIPIEEKKISLGTMKRILSYCELHDYNPPKVVKPLKSGILKEVLSEKDYLFIKDVDYENSDEMQVLIEAAIYFQMQSLQDVCICRIAVDYYTGDDQDGFEALRKRHKIEGEVTLVEQHRLQLEHPWIENK